MGDCKQQGPTLENAQNTGRTGFKLGRGLYQNVPLSSDQHSSLPGEEPGHGVSVAAKVKPDSANRTGSRPRAELHQAVHDSNRAHALNSFMKAQQQHGPSSHNIQAANGPMPSSFFSMMAAPDASDTSSCEPQPRPLPPRLSSRPPLHNQIASVPEDQQMQNDGQPPGIAATTEPSVGCPHSATSNDPFAISIQAVHHTSETSASPGKPVPDELTSAGPLTAIEPLGDERTQQELLFPAATAHSGPAAPQRAELSSMQQGQPGRSFDGGFARLGDGSAGRSAFLATPNIEQSEAPTRPSSPLLDRRTESQTDNAHQWQYHASQTQGPSRPAHSGIPKISLPSRSFGPPADDLQSLPEDRILYANGSDVSDLLLVPVQRQQQPAHGAASQRMLSDSQAAQHSSLLDGKAGLGYQQHHDQQGSNDEANTAIGIADLPQHLADQPSRQTTFASVHAMLSSIQSPTHQSGLSHFGLLPKSSHDEESSLPCDEAAINDVDNRHTAKSANTVPELVSYTKALEILGDGLPLGVKGRQACTPVTNQHHAAGCNDERPTSPMMKQQMLQATSRPVPRIGAHHPATLNAPGPIHVFRSLDMKGRPGPSHPSDHQVARFALYDETDELMQHSAAWLPANNSQNCRHDDPSAAAEAHSDELADSNGLRWLRAAAEVTARQQIAMEVIERKSRSSRCQAQRQLAFQQVRQSRLQSIASIGPWVKTQHLVRHQVTEQIHSHGHRCC